MRMYDKLIFVDKENTSMSPMAEAIMQARFALEDILVESRGLVVLFPEPINPKVEEVLSSYGLSMKEHTSLAFEPACFDERTLILTMEEDQKEKLLKEYEAAVNVFALREYVGAYDEIQDPYGGTLSDYAVCFEQLRDMTERLAEILKQEE